MSVDQTLELIQKSFTSITTPAPKMIRAEKMYRDSQIGIFYFDYSQVPDKSDFSLPEYLKKYIANDYYSHEGSLQWNFYLFFILEKDVLARMRKEGKAAEIENDRTFARKYLRESDGLGEELSRPLAGNVIELQPPKDLAAALIEKLTNAGLGAISEPDAPYVRIVDDYLSGKSTQGVAERGADENLPPALPGERIDELKIDVFREYPSQKRYSFGIANLIEGPNGSGKTSLLEAIELSICGGNRRQRNRRPQAASILVRYKDQGSWIKTPLDDLSFYRGLDLSWYGASYRKVNKLCENFGRFNFFDSDAGFRLSQGNSADDIRKAVEALFLGEYVGTLVKNIQSCAARFEPKERELAAEIRLRRGEISKLETNLSTVRNIKDTRERLASELKEKAGLAGWKDLPSQWDNAGIATLKVGIEGFCASLRGLMEQAFWMSRPSRITLKKEFDRLELAVQALEGLRRQRQAAQAAVARLTAELSSTAARNRDLSRLLAYSTDPEAWALRGSGHALENLGSGLRELKEARAYSSRVEAKYLMAQQQTVPEYLKQLNTDIASHKRALKKARTQLDRREGEEGELRTIEEGIRRLATRYCEIVPNAKECPVCGTQHRRGLRHVLRLKEPTKVANRTIHKESAVVSQEESALRDLERQKENLTLIREAASVILSRQEFQHRSVGEIRRIVSSAGRRISTLSDRIRDLTARQKRLRAKGFTEEELIELLLSLPEVKAPNRKLLTVMVANNKSAIDSLRKELEISRATLRATDEEIAKIAGEALGAYEPKDKFAELRRRRDLVEALLNLLRDNKQSVAIGQDEELAKAQSRLGHYLQLVAKAQKEFARIEERDAMEARWVASLNGLRKKLSQLEETHSRAQIGLRVLAELLLSDSKESYLGQMLSVQNRKLVDIFRRIHSPSEFVGVNLNGDVRLTREDGDETDLTGISTGQRSALAVSIFLSMNSSIGMRAPWLMFDDPVAQVDDLNTLSFLDTLRELVVAGDRQLFFATANARIANLVARKFDFLGEQFKRISLARN